MNTPSIHLIPTFHHDIAYLRPESWYTETAENILDQAISIMEENEEYTYTVEQAYFFDGYWKKYPEKRELLKKLTQRGQLHFAPGFFAVPDMSMPSGESIYMQAYYGKKILAETVEYEPKTAFIADCWGHSASLPQIMKQCGYTGYTFSRCMGKDFDIENYRWRGIDGTEINTHWMSTGYAGLFFPYAVKVNAEELQWENAAAGGVKSLAERNAEHCGDAAQIMPAGGDMLMPSPAAPAVVRGLNQRGDLPPIRFSSFEEAFDEIDFSDKPVYRGEFISSLKGTFTTNIRIKQANRRMENTIYALEVLSVLADKDADFTEPWKITLKNQFHDILCGSICDESVMQVMNEYAEGEAKLEEIRKSLTGGTIPFNTLNFPVSGIRKSGEDAAAYRADPFSAAEEIPLTGESISLPCVYENAFYRAEINDRGYITSLTDKKSGTLLVNSPTVPFGSLQLQADSGDNWVEFEYPWELNAQLYTTNVPDPYDRRSLPNHPNMQIAANGVSHAEAVSFGEDGLIVTQRGNLRYWITDVPFEITVTFAKDTPRIEYHTKFTNNTKRIRLRAAFPTIENSSIRQQIPYGISQRGEGPQPAERFMDVSSEKGGLALINRGLPHNNCEDGIMMIAMFRSVAMEYKCRSELSYNVGETVECDYAIVPHGPSADDVIWKNALHFNTPMIAAEELPKSWKVIGAYISAFRKTENGVFLRIYSGTAEAKTAIVVLPEGVTKYAFTDGLMNPGPWHEISRAAVFPLMPFEVTGILFA